MPENWEGVLILLAVTVITVFADVIRKWVGTTTLPPIVLPNLEDRLQTKVPMETVDEDDTVEMEPPVLEPATEGEEDA